MYFVTRKRFGPGQGYKNVCQYERTCQFNFVMFQKKGVHPVNGLLNLNNTSMIVSVHIYCDLDFIPNVHSF